MPLSIYLFFHFPDAPFLLRFLRTKKFSVPMAQDMLERYLVIRQLYPQWFSKLDVDDPVISDILDSGWVNSSSIGQSSPKQIWFFTPQPTEILDEIKLILRLVSPSLQTTTLEFSIHDQRSIFPRPTNNFRI